MGDDCLCFEPSGFFRLENHKGIWWLVTPDGYAFYSIGVNHISSKGYFCPKLGYSPYERAILEKYGSKEKWAQATKSRLIEWGFNTIGAWSEVELFPQFPYVLQLNFSRLAGGDWVKGTFPDVFDPRWEKAVFGLAQKICSARKNDPWLIGYFTDNELHWGPDWRNLKTLIGQFMTLPASSAGKKALVGFFRKRYNNDFSQFEKVWRSGAKNFDELFHKTKLGASWFFDRTRIKDDVYAFDELVAEKYFSTVAQAIRKYDPNHLILGCRFHGLGVSEGVIRQAGRWMDAISINYYYLTPLQELLPRLVGAVDFSGWMKKYYQLAQKPILITEFSYRAITSGLPNIKGAPVTVLTQHDRARRFASYAKKCQSAPYIIGYHWFNYMDEPFWGRFDGENSNYGLVNGKDEPWRALTEKMKKINPCAYDVHLLSQTSTSKNKNKVFWLEIKPK